MEVTYQRRALPNWDALRRTVVRWLIAVTLPATASARHSEPVKSPNAESVATGARELSARRVGLASALGIVVAGCAGDTLDRVAAPARFVAFDATDVASTGSDASVDVEVVVPADQGLPVGTCVPGARLGCETPYREAFCTKGGQESSRECASGNYQTTPKLSMGTPSGKYLSESQTPSNIGIANATSPNMSSLKTRTP